jgi:hypothetical protein
MEDGHALLLARYSTKLLDSQHCRITITSKIATDKADFLAFIPEIREKAFKCDTIIHAFRDRGIYPWDPEIALAPLREKAPPCPELQFISGDPGSPEAIQSSDTEITSSPVVPTTIRTARRRTQRLLNTV